MNFKDFLKKYPGIKTSFPDQYGDWLGCTIQEVKEETQEVITSLQIRDDHLSPSGAVHGGVISGFLDFSCGCGVLSIIRSPELCSTVELNVKYFKPIKNGEKIIAEAKVIHRGKSLCSVMAKVYNENDLEKPVALATGTFNIYVL